MRLKFSPRLISAVIVALIVAFVVQSNWGSASVSGQTIATFLVVGIALGGVYAISAAGLVVTYATTGIFNFAQAAIGCFLAFCYWHLSVKVGLPTIVAIAITLLVIAPAIGITLDRVIMRRLRDAALVVQLMVTVGLMLTFMGITIPPVVS
jgi:branched-chain amino acid transport system permease protein